MADTLVTTLATWLNYRPRDLLMFSAETYLRLLERLNQAAWPAQWLLPLLIVGLVALALGRHRWQHRLAAGLLSLALALVAWRFFGLYAEINFAAPWLAALFVIPSLALAAMAIVGPGLALDRRVRGWWSGVVLLAWGLVLHPLALLAGGRSAAGAELFGLAPDPTAIATLGLLLMSRIPRRGWLMIPPLAWCVVSGLTWWLLLAA